MKTKVVVVKTPEGFLLKTEYGFPIGPRMLTVSPKKGESFPDVPAGPFASEFQANIAKLEWNTYLLHASKAKVKKSRISE